MTDKQRLATLETLAAAICTMMDGTEWDADTLEGIAIAMRAAGFTIRDPDDEIWGKDGRLSPQGDE